MALLAVSSSQLQPFLPLLCIGAVVLWLVRNKMAGGLGRIPGPFLRSISVLPRLLSVYRGRSHLDDLELHRKYGPIVRVAPHIISVADTSQMDLLYGVSSKFYKGGFYEPTRFYDEEGLLPDPFVLSDKASHARAKRNAANAYSLNSLVRIEPLVDRVVERLCQHMDVTYAGTGRSMDLGHYMHFFSMDAIFAITFGKDLDFINKGDAKGFCKHLQGGLAYIATCGQVPWVHKYLFGNSFVSRILRSSSTGDALVDEIMSITMDQRAEAEKRVLEAESDTSLATFLMILLGNKRQNPSSINDRDINTHMFGNITAGGDTTSIAARAIFRNLIDYPDVADRLLAALHEAGLSASSADAVSVPYAVVSRIPLLTAVIRESMRLHPSAAMLLARNVPRDGAVLTDQQGRDHHLDGSAEIEIGINPWIIQRDPDVFPHPEAFRPDRWLDASPVELARMMRAWMPFGVGRHKCSGQNIALLELYKLVPTMLLRYRLIWAQQPPQISVKNHFFAIQSGLDVIVERRET